MDVNDLTVDEEIALLVLEQDFPVSLFISALRKTDMSSGKVHQVKAHVRSCTRIDERIISIISLKKKCTNLGFLGPCSCAPIYVPTR